MANDFNATMDPKMDIMSLVKASEDAKAAGSGATMAAQVEAPAEEPKKKLSPLELAKLEKESGNTGMVVNTADLKGPDNGPTKMSKAQDEGMQHSEEYVSEQDKMIEAAKSVTVTRKPKDVVEMVELMDGLETLTQGGQLTESQKRMITVGNSTTKSYSDELPDLDSEGKPIPKEEVKKENPEEEAQKKEIVQILIDKTGFGHDQLFSPDELEKISMASEIRLVEVEEAELKTANVKMSPISFVDAAKEYQLAGAKTPVSFPASHFKAQMAGLSFGEMGDIAVNPENMSTDLLHKKLSVIYNKMKNASVEFADFEDFLKHFAYTDIELAVFGIAVSTLPEAEQVPLNCHNPECKKTFYHSFSPRSLIKFDKMDKGFLEEIKKVVDCPESEAKEFFENSLVNRRKRIRLPESGFVLEIGMASAYEWLYDIMDNMLGDKFRNEHPDDLNGLIGMNVSMIAMVRKVFVPNAEGGYDEYNKCEDIINALYYIKPHEIKLLTSILNKFLTTFMVSFELRDIECPHCHQHTDVVPVDLNDLLFFKFQRQLSSSVNIDNISLW